MSTWEIFKTIGVLLWQWVLRKRVVAFLALEKEKNKDMEVTVRGTNFDEVVIEYKVHPRELSSSTIPLKKFDEVTLKAKVRE